MLNQKEVEKQTEKNKSGERKQIKEESKKKADCRSSVERIEARSEK